jgi:hypothetical protein
MISLALVNQRDIAVARSPVASVSVKNCRIVAALRSLKHAFVRNAKITVDKHSYPVIVS